MGEDLEEGLDWHARFTRQARWTHELRQYLFASTGLTGDDSIRMLEVGCGTGAVLSDLPVAAQVFGLDIRLDYLQQAAQNAHSAHLIQGDGLRLPFTTASFDIIYCHYLLLWLEDPHTALVEMRRVARPGGAVLALAEPDYGGRIDYPKEMAVLGQLQAQALREQGANIESGRQLAALFKRAGFLHVRSGVLGGQWQGSPTRESWLDEWQVIIHDLRGKMSSGELDRLQKLDELAYAHGERTLFVPTFYAWGIA